MNHFERVPFAAAEQPARCTGIFVLSCRTTFVMLLSLFDVRRAYIF